MLKINKKNNRICIFLDGDRDYSHFPLKTWTVSVYEAPDVSPPPITNKPSVRES